jgi:hypothetical protein
MLSKKGSWAGAICAFEEEIPRSRSWRKNDSLTATIRNPILSDHHQSLPLHQRPVGSGGYSGGARVGASPRGTGSDGARLGWRRERTRAWVFASGSTSSSTASVSAVRVPCPSSTSSWVASQAMSSGVSETSSSSLKGTSCPSTLRGRNRAWRKFCGAWASKCDPHSSVANFSRCCGVGAVQAR